MDMGEDLKDIGLGFAGSGVCIEWGSSGSG